jgi:hypothetical protein
MSAQCYTNKRRILAEVSVRKVQYPGSIALNNNPIYATTNCKPDFTRLVYLIKLCCTKTGKERVTTEEVTLILGAGGAFLIPTGTVLGGGASTVPSETVGGGGASGQVFTETTPEPLEDVGGGGASALATESVAGGDASTTATETASGGGA